MSCSRLRPIDGRFPQFGVDGAESAYYEPTAGFVRPERCVGAQLAVAARLGAEIRRDERVLGSSVEQPASTSAPTAASLDAERVVLAVGAWVHDFVGAEQLQLFNVYRQVLNWFELRPDAIDHRPGAMPVFIWGLKDGNAFYGFPAIDGDARGQGGRRAARQPDECRRRRRLTSTADEPRAVYDVARSGPRLPVCHRDTVCALRAASTPSRPDANFVIDEHPDLDGVLLVSPCSGHGFKHSAGLGEAIAQRVTTGVERCRPLAVPARSIRGVAAPPFRPAAEWGRTPGWR